MKFTFALHLLNIPEDDKPSTIEPNFIKIKKFQADLEEEIQDSCSDSCDHDVYIDETNDEDEEDDEDEDEIVCLV